MSNEGDYFCEHPGCGQRLLVEGWCLDHPEAHPEAHPTRDKVIDSIDHALWLLQAEELDALPDDKLEELGGRVSAACKRRTALPDESPGKSIHSCIEALRLACARAGGSLEAVDLDPVAFKAVGPYECEHVRIEQGEPTP